MNCPRCGTPWTGGGEVGQNGRCTGCNRWLVVDRPHSRLPQAPRLYAYTTHERGKAPGIRDGEVMVECPFCGTIHTHGHTPHGDGSLGHRYSHCGGVTVQGHGYVNLRDTQGYYEIRMQDGAPVAIPES